MPMIRPSDLTAGTVPGVERRSLPEGFDGWEHWPDAWFMDGLFVNAKARAALEKHAPEKCLFSPSRSNPARRARF